uniref:CRS2 n=1 Tax=Arundo donax TaxID=35708 RepID=A0A0A9F044_ARUDO
MAAGNFLVYLLVHHYGRDLTLLYFIENHSNVELLAVGYRHW